jgi:hypothetical protein
LAPEFELAFSMQPLLALAAAHTADPDAQMSLQMMSMALQNAPAGNDHIRILGETIANGQRIRFQAEESALRAVGQAVMVAAMRAITQ